MRLMCSRWPGRETDYPLPDAFYPARPQVAPEAPRPVISGDAHHECRLVWGKQHSGTPRNTVSGERKDVTVRSLALSPQKDQSCREAKSTPPGMENTPPPDHATRFGRGGLRRCVHQAAVGRHDHEDRVGPICEQDHGSQQPMPVEGAEIGADSEDPVDGGKVCLNHVAPLVGQLPLGEERAIVELKARKAARRC